MAATISFVGLVVWLIIGDGNIAELHWRIVLLAMLLVFVVASLATTEIIPWHSMSLREWRQPKVLGSLTLLLLGGAAFVAGIANVFGPDPAEQKTLTEVATAVGAGPIPADERQVWERREPGSCEALEQYLRRYPAGHYARAATNLLSSRVNAATGQSIVVPRSLPITEIPDGIGRPSIADAKAQALARAERQGARLCDLYATDQTAKLVGLQISADKWACSAAACGFEGHVTCSLEMAEVRETCGVEAK